jgi:hypothetical protein
VQSAPTSVEPVPAQVVQSAPTSVEPVPAPPVYTEISPPLYTECLNRDFVPISPPLWNPDVMPALPNSIPQWRLHQSFDTLPHILNRVYLGDDVASSNQEESYSTIQAIQKFLYSLRGDAKKVVDLEEASNDWPTTIPRMPMYCYPFPLLGFPKFNERSIETDDEIDTRMKSSKNCLLNFYTWCLKNVVAVEDLNHCQIPYRVFDTLLFAKKVYDFVEKCRKEYNTIKRKYENAIKRYRRTGTTYICGIRDDYEIRIDLEKSYDWVNISDDMRRALRRRRRNTWNIPGNESSADDDDDDEVCI